MNVSQVAVEGNCTGCQTLLRVTSLNSFLIQGSSRFVMVRQINRKLKKLLFVSVLEDVVLDDLLTRRDPGYIIIKGIHAIIR